MLTSFADIYNPFVVESFRELKRLVVFVLAEQMTQAVKIAKKSASKRLMFVEKFDNSTLFTDSTVDVDRTTVHMRRMHHGGGLKSVKNYL